MEQNNGQIQSLLARINQLEHELESNTKYNSKSEIFDEICKNQKYIEKLEVVLNNIVFSKI